MGAEEVLAIDIGGTKTLVAFMGSNGIEESVNISTPQERVEEALAEAVSRLLDKVGKKHVSRVGVSAPGPLDVYRGLLLNPPNISQKVIDLAKALGGYAEELVVANDAVASLWAEVATREGIKNAVLVTMGTGIGGGVMVDGRLLRGREGDAHEIGHLVVDHSFPYKCGCGGRGHWEAIAGGRWIARTAKFIAESTSGPNSKGREYALAGELDAPRLFSLYIEGDPFAVGVVKYLARVHAAGIASIVSAYDPEVVFLAGGMYNKNKEALLPLIRSYLGEFLWKKPGPELRDATYGELQGLWGAFYLATRPPPGHPVIKLLKR